MEEDFDLRPYISLLLTNWKLIIFPTILLVIMAFAINNLTTSPTYSATAIVVVIASRDNIEIDRSITGNNEKQPLTAFPELALSDEVLNKMLMQLQLNKPTSISNLRNNLQSQPGGDRSLIILTAKSENPEIAAEMANVWAEVFVEVANRLYVGQNEEQVLFFEEQLANAQDEMVNAETSLTEFQAINQTQIITNTLTVYYEQYTDFLQRQIQITQLNDNALLLREQLLNQPSETDTSSFADQLTYLQIQLQAFNDVSDSTILLQINNQDNLTAENRNELIEMVNGLILTLEAKEGQIRNDLVELEPQILQLQQKGQTALLEYDRLTTNLDIAKQTYNALAYQVSEERIIAQDESSGFQLVSNAVIPDEPKTANPMLAVAAGAIMGLLLSTIGILLNDWWKRQSPAS